MTDRHHTQYRAGGDAFEKGIDANRQMGSFAFASVCSAHPDVLAASLRLAGQRGVPLIVEATSNQVNQFGGYTGMQPADFRSAVSRIAAEVGMAPGAVILGGDHLGPQAWRSLPADEAMKNAADMMRAYVEAGFTKLHLDCSEGCEGEAPQVGDALAAARAADLAAVCELASESPERLSYVVGTEVPVPGGARVGHDGVIVPTSPRAAEATLAAHQEAFEARGLAAAWSRVRGLVVQPGIEFGNDHIDRLDPASPDKLRAVLDDHPHIAFEAHSTDYQHPEVFVSLARRRFAVLKVGPALTRAYRQAIYALSHIDGWLHGTPHLSMLMEDLMQAEPRHWRGHVSDAVPNGRVLRHLGYADRIRYYWMHPKAQAAVGELEAELSGTELPETLVECYFDVRTRERAQMLADGGLKPAKALVHAQIETVLEPYIQAGR